MDISALPLVEIITACSALLAGLWAMFTKLQNDFLDYLEKSEKRMVELITTKNGHFERVAGEFNKTVREFQGTISELTSKIESIDNRI